MYEESHLFDTGPVFNAFLLLHICNWIVFAMSLLDLRHSYVVDSNAMAVHTTKR